MSIVDYKISSADLLNKGNVGKPDTPNLTTSEMQRVLDEIPREVIIPKYNELIDELVDTVRVEDKITSDDITNMRLDNDGKIEVSIDGGDTWQEGGSSGHLLMDSRGATYPARSRMQFSDNVTLYDYDSEDGNKTFIDIAQGEKGDQGETATIAIGVVTSGDTPSVENVGSSTDAIFNFTLPKGDSGNSATVRVGTVSSGTSASVTNRGTVNDAILDFVLPKGDKGDMGRGLTILDTYDTLEELQTAHPTGLVGNAYMVGTENPKDLYVWSTQRNEWVNEGTLQGAKGDKGDTATVTVGTVVEGDAMYVENVGTSTDAVFNFTLKKGDKGDTGNTGTIAVGNVTEGDYANVTNVGTPTAAVFDFVLPKGAKGDKGDRGDKGNPATVNDKSGEEITLYASDISTSSTDDTKVSSYIKKIEGISHDVESTTELSYKGITINDSYSILTDMYMYAPVTLSTTSDTTITFRNSAIKDNSSIDVYTEPYAQPSLVSALSGQVSVTFAKSSASATIRVKIKISG